MIEPHLIQVQGAMERFFYKVRVNVALYNILKSKEYKDFRKQLKLALRNQALDFAKVERVNEIIGVKKVDEDILMEIGLTMMVLNQFMEEEDFKGYERFVGKQGVTSAQNILRTNQPYDLEARFGQQMDERFKEMMKQVDGTTQMWIAETIQKGVNQGMSSYDIAKLLRDSSKKMADYRSEMIAESEAAMLLGEVQIDVYRLAGIEKKKLITSRDERVCPVCVADEEAGSVPINEVFPSGSQGAPVHINCRCINLPVVNQAVRI